MIVESGFRLRCSMCRQRLGPERSNEPAAIKGAIDAGFTVISDRPVCQECLAEIISYIDNGGNAE